MTNPLLVQFSGQQVLFGGEQAAQVKAHLDAGMAHPDFARLTTYSAEASEGDFWDTTRWESRYRPYTVIDGVLQIPVFGVLMRNFPYTVGWATGYDYIREAYTRGMDDSNVKGIALLADSPGGVINGNFELADMMFARRGEKPVQAFVDGAAYSACYNIVSVADQIVVDRTGGVGSIGVRTTHVSYAKFNEKIGADYTIVFAGDGKTDGDPDMALSDDAKARMQARVDEFYEVFVSSVARNRGLSGEVIKGTLKAYCYTATQAVSNGLADKIGSLSEAVAAFAADLNQTSGDEDMSTQDKATAVDPAVNAQALAEARQAGKIEAQTRISAILGSTHATGRESLANHFAFKTDMSVADVEAALQASPVAAAPAPAPAAVVAPPQAAAQTPFEQAMAKGNPEVGGNAAEGTGAKDDDGVNAKSLLALGASLGLKGFTSPTRN